MNTRGCNATARILGVALCLATTTLWAADNGFSWQQLQARAERLASQPHQSADKVPKLLRTLTFDQWRSIRFKGSKALWPQTRFRLRLDPAGYIYDAPVKVHLIENGESKPLAFDPAMFRHDLDINGGKLPKDGGFAGVRLLHPLNHHKKFDEVLSFLGASYFRAVPPGGWYGLSARGVAVNTATQAGEEFPGFSAIWLQKPEPEAGSVTIYALLEGASVTGAYRFILNPRAKQVVMTVDARLYMRNKVTKLGLAPLTSMYLYGVGNHKQPGYPYPAVHDTDGLLIAHGDGRRIWRPLVNPPRVTVNRFRVEELAGFGLLQRDRDPSHYQAPAQHYADRPSAWIEPTGNWGPGFVELVQVPTDTETMDNIVAFWVPKDAPRAGESITLGYRIHWQKNQPWHSPKARVTATRIGGGDSGTVKFVVDFTGGGLAEIPAEADLNTNLEIVAGQAKVIEKRHLKNPQIDGWRMVLQIQPGAESATARAYLSRDGKRLTETWNYVVRPHGQSK